ncbi:uncharacterized protein Bfra_004565 [Botrytis fragariae]|uniref:Uncharacterized protein n=1 Tax=Botrytis fragariae TaxID=1964551 RepID=A0A8H6AVP5_9HELO|nr:uncharacterized protein Bfra_004565 [Botrytis fragariae]KAF5874554.1 hypothetical protein Bfra_004565 [Botrytis fragariae]
MFQYFCDLVFGILLEILSQYGSGEELMEPWQNFLPLTILRNVGDLTVREAALIMRQQRTIARISRKSNLLDKKSYMKLKRLVEDRLAERLSEMHRNFIDFVLSFENFAPLKLEMKNMGEEIQAITHSGNSPVRGRDESFHLNPCMIYRRSFLEKALMRAAEAS